MIPELHYVVTEKEIILLQEVILPPGLPLNWDVGHGQSLVVVTQFKEYLADVFSSDWDFGHWW